jgi:SAM-dependent methyltransferase
MQASTGYYRDDLAFVHDQGFSFHAERCAPGIIRLLEPVLARNGLVLELGCGSGLLTRKLLDAGHRVVATDASPAMLAIAAERVSDAEDLRQLTLPDDPLPRADAIVSVGHCLSYLPDHGAVLRALNNIARAVAPGGLFAVDICDVEWGSARRDAPPQSQVTSNWAIITRFELPSPDRFIRDITTFVLTDGNSWRRSDEHHENVLVDATDLPAQLSSSGLNVSVHSSFGTEKLPTGLAVLMGRHPGPC